MSFAVLILWDWLPRTADVSFLIVMCLDLGLAGLSSSVIIFVFTCFLLSRLECYSTQRLSSSFPFSHFKFSNVEKREPSLDPHLTYYNMQ